MDQHPCAVCDIPFKDGERIVAVMLSEYKVVPSSIHYAIKQPTQCLEIFHFQCYDGPDYSGPQPEDN